MWGVGGGALLARFHWFSPITKWQLPRAHLRPPPSPLPPPQVPACLAERVMWLNGTSLMDPINSDNRAAAGYCDVEPPTCEAGEGCRIIVPSPAYWTNSSSVSFSFTQFPSKGEAGPVRYRWAVGTERYGRDVVDWVWLEDPAEESQGTEQVWARGARAGVCLCVVARLWGRCVCVCGGGGNGTMIPLTPPLPSS